MSQTKGRFNPVKEQLKTLIAAADPALSPENSHVLGEWNVNVVSSVRNMPVVTVRVSPLRFEEMIYDRRIPYESGDSAQGEMETITFSAHVYASACNVANYEKGRWAQDLADKIIDALTLEGATPSVASKAVGIYDIFDLRSRESAPKSMAIHRIIISGRISCRRPDS